jgi:hypothetical protein
MSNPRSTAARFCQPVPSRLCKRDLRANPAGDRGAILDTFGINKIGQSEAKLTTNSSQMHRDLVML